MNHKLLPIAALCVTMAACNNTDTNVTDRIELPGTVDIEAFASNVESISVENLQMEDNWTFVDILSVCLSDNNLYMLDDSKMHLSCFDRQTGENKLF